jgi:hypothetical protein
VDEIVEEYKDIFASPIGLSIHCRVKHRIDLTPDAPLPNSPVYKCFVLENEEIKRQIQDQILNGHIKPSSSPYRSPIVLVQKRDRTRQLCIDYRFMNKITVENWYPSPRIDDFLYQCKGAQFFNKIDLRSSYHQVSIGQTDV